MRLSKTTRIIALLLLLCLLSVPLSDVFAVGAISQGEIEQLEEQMLARINQIRAQNGAGPLTRVEAIDTYARNWSLEQANQGTYFHRDWQSMQGVFDGVTEINETILMWNIDYMESLDRFIDIGVGWWENSPEHFAVITNPKYNVVGLGIVNNNGILHVTMNPAHSTSYPTFNSGKNADKKNAETNNSSMTVGMMDAINQFRRKEGLPVYMENAGLSESCQNYADKIAKAGSFEHENKNELYDLSEKLGLAIGENLFHYRGNRTDKEIIAAAIEAWLTSEGHARNMRRKDDTVFGVGIGKKDKDVYIVFRMGKEIKGSSAAEKPIPGLNYSETPVGDGGTKRAVVGPRFVIEGRNDALNGAAKIVTEQTGNNKYRCEPVDRDGNKVNTKGLVKVYMYVEPSIKRPLKIKVDGKETQFANVEGTDYVWFATEK